MIKVVNEKSDHPNQYSTSKDVKSVYNKFFYQLIDYAKKHKDKFMYIKSNVIAFKKQNGIYTVQKITNPKKACAIVKFNNDEIGQISSLDEFINLMNTGKV